MREDGSVVVVVDSPFNKTNSPARSGEAGGGPRRRWLLLPACVRTREGAEEEVVSREGGARVEERKGEGEEEEGKVEERAEDSTELCSEGEGVGEGGRGVDNAVIWFD